ncbi:MAG: P-loop NTPase [Gammaproteobacteria bacterium]|nr:P-loop NTPase [Gammaproteobacteria bacterium]MDE2252557.1 P-loop NTPase [Gammaproteobacteria bacterium]
MPQPRHTGTGPVRAAVRGPVQVIAVTGGKGGTGKTTIAVNLATALAQAGRRVLLLDGDLGLASVDVLLGLTPTHTLEQVLDGTVRLEEIMLRTPEGVSVIPAASGVARMARLEPAEHAAIVRCFAALPGDFEILIVDTAPGLNESVLAFCQAAQQQLIVLRNEPASLTDAYALIKVLSRDHRVNSFRVLVNMARDGAEAHGLFQRLQRVTDRYLQVALDYAGEIPDDHDVARAVRGQRSVLAAFPGGPAARAYRRLARDAQRWSPAQASGRLEFFFERLLTRPAARLQVIK